MQDWLNGAANNGIVLVPTTTTDGWFSFFSREGSTSNGPRLVITYSPSGGANNFDIKVDGNTLPTSATFTTDNIETANFNGVGQLDCNNNFGYSINGTPNAVNDAATVCQGVAQNINVTSNDDFGVDGPSSNPITIVSNASNGSASVNNNGTPNNPTDDRINYVSGLNFSGTDQVTYQICDSNGDCDQATLTITVQDRLSAGSNGTLTVCEGESFTTAQLFNALGGSPDPGGNWSPSPSGAGTYTYTHPASGACPATSAQVVVTEETALDPGINGTLTICAGETVTEAQLFASLGGMPDTGGVWSPALAGAGTYTYTQPAVGACPSTNAQVVVIETPNPDAGLITNGDAVCLGDPAFITLSASEPGISYQLRLESDDSNVGSPLIGNGGMLSFSATTSSTAQYNILATNTVTSCAVELANKPIVTVFVPSSAGADNSDEICAGNGSSYNLVGLLVAADPGGTWLQTGGSSFINLSNPIDVDFSNALPGEYTFTYTHEANGSCPADQAVLTVTVTSLELSNVSVSDPTCPSKDNGSIVITASTSGTQTILYSIDNGVTFQASNTFDGLTGGTYDLVVQLDIPIGCNVAPLQVTLNTPDCLPLANDDVVSTDADTPLNIPVLVNDDFGGDGVSMGTITIIASAMNGTAVVNDNGTPTDPTDDTIDYTPNTGFSGADNLFYQICDVDGDCDDAEVLISVTPPPFVALRPKMMLQGALLGTNDGLMRDDLRTANVLPLEEPYYPAGRWR